MNDFIIKFNSPPNYKKRITPSLRLVLLITTLTFIIASIKTDTITASVLALLVFLILNYNMRRWDKYFITEFSIKDETVIIRYTEQNIEKMISGLKGEFTLKKQFSFSVNRTVYLEIYFKNELLLNQFTSDEWTEKHFDELLMVFKNN